MITLNKNAIKFAMLNWSKSITTNAKPNQKLYWVSNFVKLMETRFNLSYQQVKLLYDFFLNNNLQSIPLQVSFDDEGYFIIEYETCKQLTKV